MNILAQPHIDHLVEFVPPGEKPSREAYFFLDISTGKVYPSPISLPEYRKRKQASLQGLGVLPLVPILTAVSTVGGGVLNLFSKKKEAQAAQAAAASAAQRQASQKQMLLIAGGMGLLAVVLLSKKKKP